MQPLFQYVRYGNHGWKSRYVALQKNPLILVWLLYWHGSALNFWERRAWLGGRRGYQSLGKILIMLVWYRFSPPSSDNIVVLPISGHICIKVQTGFKIVDLRNGTVAKIFFSTIDRAKIQREIIWARFVGAQPFAPTLRRWSVEQRWYQEDYADGYPASGRNSTEFSNTLLDHLVPLITRVMQLVPAREVSLSTYTDKLMKRLEMGEHGVLATHRAAEIVRIRSFVQSINTRLRSVKDQPLFMVRCHGSIALEHVIQTRHGDVLIDWESSRMQSMLFDLYDGFFRWLRSSHANFEATAILDKAIARLRACLISNDNGDGVHLATSMSAFKVYRWVYYLERLCKEMQGRTEFSKSKLETIVVFCRAFELFEDYSQSGSIHGGVDRNESLNAITNH